jgi:hypothetical protein
MNKDNIQKLEKAGDVYIKKVELFSSTGILMNLDEFFLELNLYEDIYRPCIRGKLTLSDSRNLIEILPIVGEELLLLEIVTPSFEQSINKIFRVVGIENRSIVRDKNTQVYTLNFVSSEIIYDVNLPIFKKFEGLVTDVIGDVFSNYISQNNLLDTSDRIPKEVETSELRVLVESSNKVKFVSPGWTPFKIIQWLASKAIPAEGKACNFLFYESNKSFYLTTMEYLFDTARKNNLYMGTYSLSIPNIRTSTVPDIGKELFIVNNFTQVDGIDTFKNYTNGYLSNRLITLDLNNKIYEPVDYDHTEKYFDYKHLDANPNPFFSLDAEEVIRNPLSNISFYPVQPKLFTGFKDNVNEKMKDIYGNRKSNLLDLLQFRMNITISGRTDMEVGSQLYLSFPGLKPADDATTENEYEDPLYSGYYLVTAIHHLIKRHEHKMVCEVIKDSLKSVVAKGFNR